MILLHDNQKKLGLADGISKQLTIKRALFPMLVEGKSVGLYFASRPEGKAFSERDEIWMEEVIDNVELSCEKLVETKEYAEETLVLNKNLF